VREARVWRALLGLQNAVVEGVDLDEDAGDLPPRLALQLPQFRGGYDPVVAAQTAQAVNTVVGLDPHVVRWRAESTGHFRPLD
jgi:hypothetical protein